jgi:hypothetical protein
MSTPVIYAPSIEDVAALIRARTKDSNGREAGTFTDDTRPTAAQAQEAIDHQVTALHTKVGTIGPGCAPVAQLAAAYGAAAEIELSYFPEQARADRSPYQYLIARYEEYLDGLVECVQGNLPNTPDPDDPDVQNLRYGTVDCISGTVAAYYTGRTWPPLPNPPPEPTPLSVDADE